MVLRQLQAVVTHLQPAMPANNNLSVCCVKSISIISNYLQHFAPFLRYPDRKGAEHMKKATKPPVMSIRGEELPVEIFCDVSVACEQLRREQQYFFQKIF